MQSINSTVDPLQASFQSFQVAQLCSADPQFPLLCFVRMPMRTAFKREVRWMAFIGQF